MLKINVSCLDKKTIEDKPYKIKKKNTFIKLTKDDNELTFFLVEEQEEETLFITTKMQDEQCALIGSECCNNYDCQKAIDFFYFHFFEKDDKARCYLYDLKKTVGTGIDVIKHLVAQWANSIRYTWSVLAYYNVEKYDILLGFVTEKYDEDALKRIINDYEDQEKEFDSTNIPSFIVKKNKVSHRYEPGLCDILKHFLQGKFLYQDFEYKIKHHQSQDKQYHLTFVDGNIV